MELLIKTAPLSTGLIGAEMVIMVGHAGLMYGQNRDECSWRHIMGGL
jgi:hypothetical protein